MKPSVGDAAVDSPCAQLEDEGSLEAFESGVDFEDSSLVVDFVSVACWLGIESAEGCCIEDVESLDCSSVFGSSEVVLVGSESVPDLARFAGLSSSNVDDSAAYPVSC